MDETNHTNPVETPRTFAQEWDVDFKPAVPWVPSSFACELERENAALRQAVEEGKLAFALNRKQANEAVRDAERYRWLRKMLGGVGPMIRKAYEVIDSDYVWQMDAAIDTAMSKE